MTLGEQHPPQWKTHLYGNNLTGDEKIVGLVTKLSQRVGILSKLVKIMTPIQYQQSVLWYIYL